jgi:uncharacterized protein (TIGR03790 family)
LSEAILKRRDDHNAGAQIWPCLCAALLFAFGLPVQADDASASTNVAPSFFQPGPSDQAAPGPGEQPTLTLRPDTAPTSPLMNPSGGEFIPDIFHEYSPTDGANNLAGHLLVVYNSNDPESRGLAEYYAAKRNIPAERVFGMPCATTEEITRAQYDDSIRSPITTYLTRKGWLTRMTQPTRIGEHDLDLLVATHNDIWAIVLMRGMPLKIQPDWDMHGAMEPQPELQTNAAAVDSELAMLPVYGLPLGGYVPNIFFDDQLSGIKRIGPELARNLILVTRLDGPSVSNVRRMIDDSLYAEQHRLAGLAVVDTRGLTDVRDGYTAGDIWLRGSRDELARDGWMVKFDDKSELIPATDPCNQVGIYLGWYSQEAQGPWVTWPNRFVPGAIAYHIHSFSASTVRADYSHWVGPLIAHGADATMGMVYEPYLALTPHTDIFTRRLLQGDYFAEAAYASERGLSWMLTVVGDPLYRPFRVPLASALAEASNPHTPHDDWLLLQQVQREIASGEMKPTTTSLQAALQVPGAGPVAAEGLGDLLDKLGDPANYDAIEEAYRKAMLGDTEPVDHIRVGLKLAQFYSNHNEEGRAQAEIDSLREDFPKDSLRFGVSAQLVPTSAAAANPVVNPAANPVVGMPAPTSTPSPNAPPPTDALPKLPQLPKPTPVAP